MLVENLLDIIEKVPGKAGFYYKDLNSGCSAGFNENEGFVAASVIKIPVMIETLKQIEEGKMSVDSMVRVKREDKVPSCGAINYMHDGLEVSIKDLYTLMIILSDNTATNILINILGIENINKTMEDLGLKVTRLNRLLFDAEAERKGKRNYIAPAEIGFLLEKIYKGELLSESISKEIERVLKMQLYNSKIPRLLPESVIIGHKTGEDSGTTHDVGIVYGKAPFIFCFASNDTNVPVAEDALSRMALLCYERSEEK